jgi:hypothetical protein
MSPLGRKKRTEVPRVRDAFNEAEVMRGHTRFASPPLAQGRGLRLRGSSPAASWRAVPVAPYKTLTLALSLTKGRGDHTALHPLIIQLTIDQHYCPERGPLPFAF